MENKQYSGTAVDVWSLGVLLFITVTGHSPYKGKVRRSVHTSDVAAAAADSSTFWQTHNDMLRAIMRARLPTSAPGWAELSTELQDLISVMLQVIPRSCLPRCRGSAEADLLRLVVSGQPQDPSDDVGGRRASLGAGRRSGRRGSPRCQRHGRRYGSRAACGHRHP